MWGIILGGSSGFGYATVEKLAKQGMNIAVLYRETGHSEKEIREKLSRIAEISSVIILPYNINALDEGGRSMFIQQFTKVVSEKKCIRLLFHSIARGNLKPFVLENHEKENLTKEQMCQVLSNEDIELTAYAMATSLLDWTKSLMKEDLFFKDARIIGLTSEGAHKYWDSYAAVSIAKATLESLCTYMAVELRKYGLRTNLIQAGITDTPSLKKIPGSKKLIEMTAARNPSGRMTIPEDVANVVYLLCTDDAQWINGSIIHVDGGEHCR
jgi:enoyl-[acyl-carrier protein] reductase III